MCAFGVKFVDPGELPSDVDWVAARTPQGDYLIVKRNLSPMQIRDAAMELMAYQSQTRGSAYRASSFCIAWRRCVSSARW